MKLAQLVGKMIFANKPHNCAFCLREARPFDLRKITLGIIEKKLPREYTDCNSKSNAICVAINESLEGYDDSLKDSVYYLDELGTCVYNLSFLQSPIISLSGGMFQDTLQDNFVQEKNRMRDFVYETGLKLFGDRLSQVIQMRKDFLERKFELGESFEDYSHSCDYSHYVAKSGFFSEYIFFDRHFKCTTA